jgi:hypothetical protein
MMKVRDEKVKHELEKVSARSVCQITMHTTTQVTRVLRRVFQSLDCVCLIAGETPATSF